MSRITWSALRAGVSAHHTTRSPPFSWTDVAASRLRQRVAASPGGGATKNASHLTLRGSGLIFRRFPPGRFFVQRNCKGTKQ